MLAELVTKGAAAFEASAARTTAFSSAAAQRLDQGILAFNSAQSGIHTGAVQHSAEIKALLAQSSQQFTTDMSVVSLQRETADNTLSTVSGMVGAKRKYLDVTVTELCAHVDAAIEQGVTVVDATSATANKVLSDVSSASQAMNATASGAMDTFTAFMDQEGEALRSGLQDHFNTVSAHAQAQNGDLVALKKAAGIHSETMEGHRLPSSGRTPQKVAPVSFEGPFKRTRSHGVIRSEAKAQILQTEDGEPISYDVARAGIIDCIALSASIPMEAESEVEVPFVAAIEAVAEHVVSDRSSTGSAASSSTISSKESSSGKFSVDGELEVDGEGGFLLGPSENVNPNITTTRQSRGNAKSRSKLAAPGSSRSSRSALAAAMDSDA